ncbi:MAG: hypothetical protein ACREFD_01360 [Stellaceae bacterium]
MARFPVLAFERPILVFGDGYGNLEATHALPAEAKRPGIGPEAQGFCRLPR